MREIKIQIGENLDEEGIQRALEDSNTHGQDAIRLYPVAEALMNVDDCRFQIYGVTIEEVTINQEFPNQVTISFTSSWSHYVGCRDANSAGDQDECETATYTADGHLIFLVPDQEKESNYC
ncbi:hypothetical protein [Undibacterium sp. TJN19]|uniref:hypothetical protein n=1 Tax=Undibacterium sp. TJN19 TaxID=3413055 RepID=UPI003BF3F142